MSPQDTTKLQLADTVAKNAALENQIEESRARETQLRTSNKVNRIGGCIPFENLPSSRPYAKNFGKCSLQLLCWRNSVILVLGTGPPVIMWQEVEPQYPQPQILRLQLDRQHHLLRKTVTMKKSTWNTSETWCCSSLNTKR
jgi:hypothetical protein